MGCCLPLVSSKDLMDEADSVKLREELRGLESRASDIQEIEMISGSLL